MAARRCSLMLAILLVAHTPACSSNDGTGGTGGGGEGEGEGPADAGSDADSADATEEGASLIPAFASFQIVFYYPKDSEPPERDLYLVQQAISPASVEAWLGEDYAETLQQKEVPGREFDSFLHALTKSEGVSVLSCASCVLSPDGTKLAWAEEEPGSGQQQLWVADVDPGWQIRLDRKYKATSAGAQGRLDTKSLGFAGDWLVYGIATAEREIVMAQDSSEAGANDHELQVLPAGGGFSVDPLGRHVITLEKKTLASMGAWSASPSGEANPILLHVFEVENASTGSDYSGTEPVAVSPDGRYVAIVTEARESIAGSAYLKVHTLTTDPVDPGTGHISEVKLGPSGQTKCTVPREADQYTDVDEDPVWSPDGRYLYVLAYAPANCGTRQYTVDDTAILRIDVADNGVLGGVTNLTPTPQENDHPLRVAIQQFSLSPDGKMFVVSATPPDRIRSRELYAMPARTNEVY